MRKFLVALGAMTLAVVVAAGIGVGILIYKGKSLDRESKAYVDSAVPAIVTVWSKYALLDQATPELRANALKGYSRRLCGHLLGHGSPKPVREKMHVCVGHSKSAPRRVPFQTRPSHGRTPCAGDRPVDSASCVNPATLFTPSLRIMVLR